MNCTRVVRVGIQGPPGASGPNGGASVRQLLIFSPSNIYSLQFVLQDPSKSTLFVNGVKQTYGADYTINNTVLTWVSTNLSLSVNDTIEIYY